MTGPELAKVLVDRLNELIAEPPIRAAVDTLIMQRVEFGGDVAKALRDHPAIQVGGFAGQLVVDLGLVGLLNGICGADENGVGYLAYRYEDGRLLGFELFGKAAES